MDDLSHLSWPFFDSSCFEFARGFDRWVRAELGGFETDEGGDGKAARQIFERLATAGWLRNNLPTQTFGEQCKISLRHVSLMREISAFSSAIADVALSEPWLGILPIALYGSQGLRDELLPHYLAGRLLPAFALSEPNAGSDAAAITTRSQLPPIAMAIITSSMAARLGLQIAAWQTCMLSSPGSRDRPVPAESQRLRLMDMTAASCLRNVFRSCLPTLWGRGPSRIAASLPSA
jgi:Acyl-CoA dehydrogenase, N-terminal domain